jgi:hypothetical protein
MYVITEAINPLRARNGVRNNREYVISEYAISVQFSIENRWDHVREYVITESVITKFYCSSVPISTQKKYLSTSTKYMVENVLLSTSTSAVGEMYLSTYKYSSTSTKYSSTKYTHGSEIS